MKNNSQVHQLSFQVSVLIKQDENLWVAQCLEYDIATQARSEEDVKKSFEKVFVGQILLDICHGKTPLQGIQRAPKYFWDIDPKPQQAERKPFYLPDSIPAGISATAVMYQ